MSASDKISNMAQKAHGKVEEVVGSATGDEEKRAEGNKDQAAGEVKQRGEHLKDAFKG